MTHWQLPFHVISAQVGSFRMKIFFDAGVYVVTSTVTTPAGTPVVKQAWSTLAGKGAAFQNQNKPQTCVQGWGARPGSQGIL